VSEVQLSSARKAERRWLYSKLKVVKNAARAAVRTTKREAEESPLLEAVAR
jgi:hypothetical protein